MKAELAYIYQVSARSIYRTGLYLFVFLILTMVILGLSTTGKAADALTWAPPKLDNPTTVTVSNSNRIAKLDPNKDYIVKAPTEITAPGGIEIVGGRNVVLIGAKVRHDTNNGYTRGLYLKQWTGTMHVEGVWITGKALTEGINADTRTPGAVLQVQNVRVDEVRGSYEGHHADVIQNWGGPTIYRIDKLTGTTNYQGMMIGPTQFDGKTELLDMRRVNFIGSGRYKIFSTSEGFNNSNFVDVWTNNKADNSPCGCYPHNFDLWKDIKVGIPPGGDFVPAGSVGLNYVSPGYSNGSTLPSVNTPPKANSAKPVKDAPVKTAPTKQPNQTPARRDDDKAEETIVERTANPSAHVPAELPHTGPSFRG